MNVLMVCTGNICRSPMAEGMLRARLNELGCDGVSVSSAGTWAGFGQRPTIEAIQAAEGYGADISGFRSSPLQEGDLAESDLVVAMTSVHLRELETLAPDHMHKVRLLKEIPELEIPSGPAGVKALLEAPRPAPRRGLDLDDPIGLPISAYERCAREIDATVAVLVDVLCGA